MLQESKKISEKHLKCYGHVIWREEEHTLRRRLVAEILGKRRRGRLDLRWKDVCRMVAGMREDDVTNRAEWKNKSSAVTATPDDGTSI